MQTKIFKCLWLGFWLLMLGHGLTYTPPNTGSAASSSQTILGHPTTPAHLDGDCHSDSHQGEWTAVDSCEDIDLEWEGTTESSLPWHTLPISLADVQADSLRSAQRHLMWAQRPFYLMYAQWKWHLNVV